jgi:hypothetical protein
VVPGRKAVRPEGLLLMPATAKRVNCPRKCEIATGSGSGYRRAESDPVDGVLC